MAVVQPPSSPSERRSGRGLDASCGVDVVRISCAKQETSS